MIPLPATYKTHGQYLEDWTGNQIDWIQRKLSEYFSDYTISINGKENRIFSFVTFKKVTNLKLKIEDYMFYESDDKILYNGVSYKRFAIGLDGKIYAITSTKQIIKL